MQNLLSLLIGLAVMGLIAWIFFPERGLLAQWRNTRQMTGKVRREDAIKHIYDCEVHGREPSRQSVAGALHIDVDTAHHLLAELERHDLVKFDGSIPRLTASGRDLALHLLRAHRLWERYLADETGFSELDWHGQAERREHFLTSDDLDELSARLSNPIFDPHGDPIPSANGEFGKLTSEPLTAVESGSLFQIVHLEDEPESVYAQLVAEGLHPGMPLRLLSRDDRRLLFWAGGDEHVLAPMVAANIFVKPIEEEPEPVDGEQLMSLAIGESARVIGLAPSLRGAERRRMMDLGLLPGTTVRAEHTGAGGSPTAYRIRGALIALRNEQAAQIIIQKEGRQDHD